MVTKLRKKINEIFIESIFQKALVFFKNIRNDFSKCNGLGIVSILSRNDKICRPISHYRVDFSRRKKRNTQKNKGNKSDIVHYSDWLPCRAKYWCRERVRCVSVLFHIDRELGQIHKDISEGINLVAIVALNF